MKRTHTLHKIFILSCLQILSCILIPNLAVAASISSTQLSDSSSTITLAQQNKTDLTKPDYQSVESVAAGIIDLLNKKSKQHPTLVFPGIFSNSAAILHRESTAQDRARIISAVLYPYIDHIANFIQKQYVPGESPYENLMNTLGENFTKINKIIASESPEYGNAFNAAISAEKMMTYAENAIVPPVVELEIYTNDGYLFFCTGALIANNIIITAAHCLNNKKTPLNILAYSGKNFSNVSEVPLAAEGEDWAAFNNVDIGLIRLRDPINNMIPFTLPVQCSGTPMDQLDLSVYKRNDRSGYDIDYQSWGGGAWLHRSGVINDHFTRVGGLKIDSSKINVDYCSRYSNGIYFVTPAVTNPGDSGGPWVDISWNVQGITSHYNIPSTSHYNVLVCMYVNQIREQLNLWNKGRV